MREELVKKNEIEKTFEGYTFSFHNDERPTVVCINEKIYNLVDTGIVLKDLIHEKDFEKLPHVRILNPIPSRSRTEEEIHNTQSKRLHELYSRIPQQRNTLTPRKAQVLGKDVPEEVKRLMEEKEKALKAGDTEKAKKIRKQLRNLDYKRYMKEE